MCRKRLIPALTALALLFVVGCDDLNPASDKPVRVSATIRRLDDGDTLTVASGAKVRLVQIDAPELTTDCYGREALRALGDLVEEGARVTLVRDPALDDRDKYGRLLRYVFVNDTDVNVELVRRGAASPYFFRGERGAHADALLDAVEAARAEHAGLWGACPDARLNPGLGSITGTG